MSDCSMDSMKSKERRTCGTCKHVSSTLLDCFYASNDSNFYMRCTRPDVVACEHYENDPDSLPRRCERLAQVAREMLMYIGSFTLLLDHRHDDRDAAQENARRFMEFDEQIKECEVNVK